MVKTPSRKIRNDSANLDRHWREIVGVAVDAELALPLRLKPNEEVASSNRYCRVTLELNQNVGAVAAHNCRKSFRRCLLSGMLACACTVLGYGEASREPRCLSCG